LAFSSNAHITTQPGTSPETAPVPPVHQSNSADQPANRTESFPVAGTNEFSLQEITVLRYPASVFGSIGIPELGEISIGHT
jgi:hypothetical protein